jgi:O-succinylbenzoic acid--CoA ligase
MDWVDAAATDAPGRPALILEDGVVTYHQLRELIGARVGTLAGEYASGEVVPTPVRLDLPSVVEMLALPIGGFVPLPYVAEPTRPSVRSAPGAIVCIATSGSGGRRRLVPLSMGNISASVHASRIRLDTGPEDRWWLTLPLDHIGGMSVLYRSLEAAGSVVIGPFDRHRRILDVTQPTVASLVPTMVHRMLGEDPGLLAAIRTVLVGGGPLRTAVLDAAVRAGVHVLPTYGSTETSSQVATVLPGREVPHAGYVGSPLEGFTVDIDDAGIIAVDGPAVFSGYLGGAQRIGVHRTGDLGRWEDDGGLTVLGRVDDVVTSGGENVSLTVVSDAIGGIDGIEDVAVVAIDDDEWGSSVCAYISSDLAPVEVEARIAEVLSGPSRPRRVIVGTGVPTMTNGKHDLAAVRDLFAEGPDIRR